MVNRQVVRPNLPLVSTLRTLLLNATASILEVEVLPQVAIPELIAILETTVSLFALQTIALMEAAHSTLDAQVASPEAIADCEIRVVLLLARILVHPSGALSLARLLNKHGRYILFFLTRH